MRFVISIVFIFGIGTAYAQIESDSIYISKNFLGLKFYQKSERLNVNQLPQVMEGNTDAFELISKAKNRHVLSSIISGAGGFLLGLQLANAIIGGEPNWAMAGVAGGLIVVSIPIYLKSSSLSLSAVEMYNRGLVSSLDNKPQLYFGMNHHGLGLRYVF